MSEFEKKFKKLSFLQKTAMGAMLDDAGKKARGRRYTRDQKIFYLSQQKKSPAAYRGRQKMMDLLSQSTLQTILKTFNLDPVINPVMKDRLIDARNKMMDKLEAVCTLIWDELSPNSAFRLRS